MKKQILFILTIAFIFSINGYSQNLNTPSPSPLQTLTQAFGLSKIEISYSRPSMNGRTVFGDLVPYDKMWRTGANKATNITFGDNVMVGGKTIEKGTYALYTIPGKTDWTIILNKGINNGGLNGYKESDDVVRFTVPSVNLPFKIETFTITIDNLKDSYCEISLLWENKMVNFSVKTSIDEQIMSQIDQQMNKDNRPYFAAASYYYNNDKNLNDALNWVNKAIEQNPNAFWMVHLKAKIQAKSGDKNGAIKSANESITLAKTANNNDYVVLNEKLIQSLK